MTEFGRREALEKGNKTEREIERKNVRVSSASHSILNNSKTD